VLAAIKAWEDSSGEAFLYKGERYSDRVTKQDREFTEWKEAFRSRSARPAKTETPFKAATLPA
jgi:hypothetical protein